MAIDHRRVGPNSGASPWNCSGTVLLPCEVTLVPLPAITDVVGSFAPLSDFDVEVSVMLGASVVVTGAAVVIGVPAGLLR